MYIIIHTIGSMDNILKTDIPISDRQLLIYNLRSSKPTCLANMCILGAGFYNDHPYNKLVKQYAEQAPYYNDICSLSKHMMSIDIDMRLIEIIYEYGILPTTPDPLTCIYISKTPYPKFRSSIKYLRDKITDKPIKDRFLRYKQLGKKIDVMANLIYIDMTTEPSGDIFKTLRYISNLVNNSDMILRVPLIISKPSIVWITMLCIFFESVNMYKPLADDILQSEIYIICRRCLSNDISVIQGMQDADIPKTVVERVRLFNIWFYKKQIEYCDNLRSLCLGTTIEELESIKKEIHMNILKYRSRF